MLPILYKPITQFKFDYSLCFQYFKTTGQPGDVLYDRRTPSSDYTWPLGAIYRLSVGVWILVGLAWVAGIISSLQDCLQAVINKVEGARARFSNTFQVGSQSLTINHYYDKLVF